MRALAHRDVLSVLVEGGPTLHRAFWDAGIVDRVQVIEAPLELGEGSGRPSSIGIQIIPFTREHTTLGDRRAGDHVNLEADIIGKYAARLAELSRGPVAR
jgi:riboflavin biosynthesis pyrimidine reductase